MAAQWEQWLQKAKELRGKSNGLLWERTKLLVQVWNDGDYLAFHKGDIDKAEAFLDAELGDYGLCFSDVKCMFDAYPTRKEWEGGKLRELLAKALAKADEAHRERAGEAARSVHRVTKKEFEEVTKEKEKVEARSVYMESELEAARRKIDELTAENRRLQADLARAEGRISELERFTKRELAAA